MVIAKNKPLTFFDYQVALEAWDISYIIITSSEIVSRFAIDSLFTLVYENSEVAVFKVNASA